MANADTRKAQLINKVRNLMKLAENPGATEDERDNASKAATKMIAKYQIEAAELRDAAKGEKADIVMFRMNISNKLGLGVRRADALTFAVIHPMGGKSLRTNPKMASYDSILTVFVSEDIKEAVEILLNSLALQMESGMAKAVAKYRRELTDPWSRLDTNDVNRLVKAFRMSYLRTFGFVVGDRVAKGREEALGEVRMEAQAEAYAKGVDGKELASVGAELVLVDDSARTQSAMEAWYSEKNGEKKKIRKGRSSRLHSDAGLLAGRRDGLRADIGQTRIEAPREMAFQ